MKRITGLFSRDKKPNRAEETSETMTLTSCEEEEVIKNDSSSKKKKDKKDKDKDKDKDKEKRLRPNFCSGCGAHYRVCVCGHCYICDTFVLSVRGMRHCPRCWKPICDGCTVYPKGDEHLNEEEECVDKAFLCETCAHNSAIHELALLPEDYVPVLDGKSVEGRITYHFSWGLYMLLKAASEPRICLNPSCTRRRTYRIDCEPCAVPTLPSIFFDCDRTSMLALRPPQDLPTLLETSTISAMNKMYGIAQKSIPEELTEDQADMYAANVLPCFRERFNAFPNGIDTPAASPSSSIAMRSMLSTIAIGVTEVPCSISAARLSMSDHPLALLLHLRTAEKSHCEFGSAGGGPEYIAFPSSGLYSDIAEQLHPDLTPMEIWRCGENDVDANGQQRIGFIARDSDAAIQEGGAGIVFQFSVVSGVWSKLQLPALQELKAQIIGMRQSGAQLVLCGRGVGGAIATLMTLVLLIEHTELMAGGIQCITFGSPGVVSGSELIEYLEEMQLSTCFHHFVYRSDIMARYHYFSAFLNAGEMQEGWGGEGSLLATEIKQTAWNWFDKMRLFRESVDFEGFSHKLKEDNKKEKKSKHDRHHSTVSLGEVPPSSMMANFKCERTASWFSGDLFFQHREPFDNNLGAVASRVTIPDAIPTQFGCYHCFYLHPDQPYQFCNRYREIGELLAQRHSLPVKLRDHLLASYSKTLVEYLHSYNVCPEGL